MAYADWVKVRLDEELRKCLIEALARAKGHFDKAAINHMGCCPQTFRRECHRLNVHKDSWKTLLDPPESEW